jgi:hypothetical protein
LVNSKTHNASIMRTTELEIKLLLIVTSNECYIEIYFIQY